MDRLHLLAHVRHLLFYVVNVFLGKAVRDDMPEALLQGALSEVREFCQPSGQILAALLTPLPLLLQVGFYCDAL